MNNSIKLSIIVPVYNVEKYLEQCLKSLIKNIKSSIEIILVNDGSTDRSGKICDEYAKKYEYINVIHKENGGLSSARNSGLNIANGVYIWFVDSDDYIEDSSFDNIYKAIESNVDLIIGNYRRVYPDGKTFFYQPFKENDDFTVPPYKYFDRLGNISYAAVRFILKKDVIVNNKLYFTQGLYHEDEDWTPRALCAAKTYRVILPAIYNYRVGNPSSITGMLNAKKVLDKIQISKNINNLIDTKIMTDDMVIFLKNRVAHNYIAAIHECSLYKNDQISNIINELRDNIYLLDGIKTKKATLVRNSIKLVGFLYTSRILRLRSYINER